MKVVYIKLENVAGLYVGSNRDSLEITFDNSHNKIVNIAGSNGKGKSVLISSIHPFATTISSIDDRSSLPYIRAGKDGYKEIHYTDNFDYYIIKHYFRATKDSHSVKSYIQLNGNELNENGNVTSFLSLIEMQFGLTPEMMRLMRLGSNVNSFITLTPSHRKEYIAKLITEVNTYLTIHKKIGEDVRFTKKLVTSNAQNLYNCRITDIQLERDKLSKLLKTIGNEERKRDAVIKEISKIEALENSNNVGDLRNREQELKGSLYEFNKVDKEIHDNDLSNETVDGLINKRSGLMNDKIAYQSKINSYRISVDNALKQIDRLETAMKKITHNNDMNSLILSIGSLQDELKKVPKQISGMNPPGCTSTEVYEFLTKLQSFNNISQSIQTYGDGPVRLYLKLRTQKKSVDKFLKDQMKRNLSRITDSDIKRLVARVFEDDFIIQPNCDHEYKDCPYYRLANIAGELKEKYEDDMYDDETLNYVKNISQNIDNMMNELYRYRDMKLTESLKDLLVETKILDRMERRLPFFDLTELHEYLSIIREYEIFLQNLNKLKESEIQLSLYQQSGIDRQQNEINELNDNIKFYQTNISVLESDVNNTSKQLEGIDYQITLVGKYQDSMKNRKVYEASLESISKILVPLETAGQEKIGLQHQLANIDVMISHTREEAKELEANINEFNRLTDEGIRFQRINKELNVILSSVSTRRGIPMLYMKKYLEKIQQLSNNLLGLIYEEELQLANFRVDEQTFLVPYIKNGMLIDDVKYASQSEIALITMALSFALANHVAGSYNILLLDEIDAGLDEKNRTSFLKMLYQQMDELRAEQCFIISHNISEMLNLNMDVIKLSETRITSSLQNVIYEQ